MIRKYLMYYTDWIMELIIQGKGKKLLCVPLVSWERSDFNLQSLEWISTQVSSWSSVFSVLSGPVTCADSHLETVSGQLTETGRVREVFSLT